MELVDALCSYPSADSPVELTLPPLFRRTHTALYKSIADTAWEDLPMAELLSPYLPRPKARSFWLIGVDVTSQPQQFGQTVADRGFVYQPNLVAGNKPVTIGHQYSTLAFLPEKEKQVSGSWVVPLSTARVATDQDQVQVGAQQVNQVLDDPKLPWHDQPVVQVGDSRYSKAAYIDATHQDHEDLVSILRVLTPGLSTRPTTPAAIWSTASVSENKNICLPKANPGHIPRRALVTSGPSRCTATFLSVRHTCSTAPTPR